MNLDEYVRYDALGLAELVRDGEVSAGELCDIARKAGEAVDTKLNLVVGWLDDVHSESPAEDARFVGVPTFLKDLGAGIAGVPQEMGSRLTAGASAPITANFTQRMLDAGFRIIGRSACPEFGLTLTTESAAHGPSRNPWNPEHITGGSSGGSAALVAAGVVPLAHSNDGGGSTRIPASICGNVGLKTSRGRISLGPVSSDVTSPLVAEGCNCKTVRDAAAFLDAVAGPGPGEAAVLAAPDRSYLDGLNDAPRQYRIALSLDPWSGDSMDPDIRREMERIGQVLRDLGHHVEEATPAVLTTGGVTEAFKVLWFSMAELVVKTLVPLTNRTPGPDTLERHTLEMVERGEALSALDVNLATGYSNIVARELAGFFSDWDLILTPTLNRPTPRLGSQVALSGEGTLDDWFRAAMAIVPHTPVANFTGLPAISVPCGIGPGDLPLGMHFMGSMGREDRLLDIARQLEQAEPWTGRRPVTFVV